jgi:hypothetical protein
MGDDVGDLQVDTAALDALTKSLTSVPGDVRVERALTDPREDALGSDDVASALGRGASDMADRADVLVESITAIGKYPASVARQFEITDEQLAQAAGLL